MATLERTPSRVSAPTNRGSWATIRILLNRIRSGSVTKQKRKSAVIEGRRAEVLATSGEKNIQHVAVTAIEIEKPKNIQRALVVARKGEYEIRNDFLIPEVGDGEVMIRSHYVGLNPIDFKTVDFNFCLPAFPWVTGREMSGVVEKVGKDVSGLQPGDKVWTSTYYRDIRAGCFQEHVVVPPHTVSKIPECVPMEAAACLGVPALTACMTLWKWLRVPMPSQTALGSNQISEEERWILIWGAGSVTGQFCLQAAAASGLKVITVNGSSTKSLCERLGASHVVIRDGKTDAEILEEIKTVLQGAPLIRAIDVVGPKTAAVAIEALSKDRPADLAPLNFLSKTQVVPENVTAHTIEMKRYILEESSRCYSDELNLLLAANKLTLPEIHLMEGGLEDIEGGLERLKKGNMQGKKLVVRI